MQRATGLFSRHALALLILLGGLVRFATLGAQDFWLDELVTVQVIGQGPIDLLKSVAAGESNPGLYYLLAGGWEHVFGEGEFALRSLSALFGTATIPAVYAATAALSNRRAGLVAAALTATSPLLVWYSQEARNYSLLVLLSALAFLFFARALEDRDHRWLWAWALTSGLALSTHYFAVALVAPQVVWLWMRRPGPRADTAFATAAIGVVGIALLPLLATQRGRGDWISFFALGDRLGQVPQHFVVGLEVPWAAIAPAAAAVAVGAATYA